MTDILVSTKEAAALAHQTPEVIRQWAARGHLPVAERTRTGRPRYWRMDVLRLERATRRGEPLAEANDLASHCARGWSVSEPP